MIGLVLHRVMRWGRLGLLVSVVAERVKRIKERS